MEYNGLYPELIDYIFYHCQEFQTDDEKIAGRTVMYEQKNLKEPIKSTIIKKGWYSDAPHIQQMISNGFGVFKNNVATRIFKEHRDELDLNLCPKCFKIARTPSAKQCRFCFYDWH
jgi:hypothetical protein